MFSCLFLSSLEPGAKPIKPVGPKPVRPRQPGKHDFFLGVLRLLPQ